MCGVEKYNISKVLFLEEYRKKLSQLTISNDYKGIDNCEKVYLVSK